MRGIDELTEVEKQTEKETEATDIALMIKTIYDFIVGDVKEDTETVEEKEDTETVEEKEDTETVE